VTDILIKQANHLNDSDGDDNDNADVGVIAMIKWRVKMSHSVKKRYAGDGDISPFRLEY